MVIKNDNGIRLSVESHGTVYDEPVNQLLVSVGRAPNVDQLNLEAVGAEFHQKGVTVNDRLQTTNPMIYGGGRRLSAISIYARSRLYGYGSSFRMLSLRGERSRVRW
ncbi:MAG: FAD-dependent oxidoreductase [Pirellulaceae bacterium]